MAKILIVEPWEFETINGANPYEVTLLEVHQQQLLIIFLKEIIIGRIKTRYLLGKKVTRNGMQILQMAFIPDMNIDNIHKFSLNDHRGAFITGELLKSSY